MKIEGRPCKIVLVDLFFSTCFPPLPYLIHLFTYDSVTDCIPQEPGYILTKFSICYSESCLRNIPHALPILFLQSFSRSCIIKGASITVNPQKTQTLQQKEVCPFFCLNKAEDFASLLVMRKG